MANHDDTGGKVADELSGVEAQLSPSEQRRDKLPLLLRSARAVAVFSPECETCRGLQNRIVGLGADLAAKPRMTRQNFKSYLTIIMGVTKHLKRKHGLTEEKHYVTRLMSMTLAGGLSLVALGLILLSFGITLLTLNITVPALVVRVMFAYTIGCLLDKRARKQGKVF